MRDTLKIDENITKKQMRDNSFQAYFHYKMMKDKIGSRRSISHSIRILLSDI